MLTSEKKEQMEKWMLDAKKLFDMTHPADGSAGDLSEEMERHQIQQSTAASHELD